MSNYQVIDIERWPRRESFYFYKDFEIPFFNITAELDVSRLVEYCQVHQLSFFLASLFAATRTANTIEAFRYRLSGDEVLCFGKVHCGSTILYDDNSFGFCYFEYVDELHAFCQNGQQEIENQKQQRGMDPRDDRLDMLHFSIIPWIRFTGFQHARRLRHADSIPKIVFGKYAQLEGRYRMPLSVEVHHALMDGYHVGQYFKEIQKWMDEL